MYERLGTCQHELHVGREVLGGTGTVGGGRGLVSCEGKGNGFPDVF